MTSSKQASMKWKTMRLEELAEIIMGQSPSSEAYNIDKNGIPFFQGKADFSRNNRHPIIRQWTTEITKIAPKDSILFTVRAPVGDIVMNNIEACIGRGLASIKAKNGYSNIFLFYYLTHLKNEFEKLSQGSTFTAINSQQLKNIKLCIPVLEDQKKIATILSKVDEEIEKTEQIISQTEKLRNGLMEKLLTRGTGYTKLKKTELGETPEEWEVVNLGEVAKITNGQVDPKQEPYRSMILIAPNHIESSSGAIIAKESAEAQRAISGKYFVDQGDIIYSKIRPYLKKVVLADEQCLCSADMYPIKGTNKLNSIFLFYTLLSNDFTDFANSNSARTGIPKINREELNAYKFALPPLKKQEKIGDILSMIDKKNSANKRFGAKLIFLKKGLMNNFFNH